MQVKKLKYFYYGKHTLALASFLLYNVQLLNVALYISKIIWSGLSFCTIINKCKTKHTKLTKKSNISFSLQKSLQ